MWVVVWLVLQGLGMFPNTDNVMKKKLKDLFLVLELYFAEAVAMFLKLVTLETS